MAQSTKQVKVVSGAEAVPGQDFETTAFFDENGSPVDIGGGGDVSVAWGDVTGKPSTFAPATHTHVVADVTGLQAILDDYETRIAALEAAGA